MRLILVGCEYSGTTTLSYAISKWARKVIGGDFGFHDHWKVPHVSHPPGQSNEENDELYTAWLEGRGEDPTVMGLSDEEQEQFLALSPKLKEGFQRYHMEYHVAEVFYEDRHHNNVGFHIDEAVYAPLYYGYGGAGEYADRHSYVRTVERTIQRHAPDTVLVLVKASADVIARRLKENPHKNGLVQETDIDHVLERFQQEFDGSSLRHKIVLDTSTATVGETLAEFVEKIEPHLTQDDRLSMMSRQLAKLSKAD